MTSSTRSGKGIRHRLPSPAWRHMYRAFGTRSGRLRPRSSVVAADTSSNWVARHLTRRSSSASSTRCTRRLRPETPQRVVDLATSALALWRGPPLTDLQLEVDTQIEAERLGELRLNALELRFDAELQLRRHEAVASELRRLVEEHPYRERFAFQLMVSLTDRAVRQRRSTCTSWSGGGSSTTWVYSPEFSFGSFRARSSARIQSSRRLVARRFHIGWKGAAGTSASHHSRSGDSRGRDRDPRHKRARRLQRFG